MRAVVITNGYLQPMLFGGMAQVEKRVRAQIINDKTRKLLFARWRDFDGIVSWLDGIPDLEYANMLGYSYGGSTNGFVAKARPQLEIRNWVGVDPVWRPEIQKIDPDSLEESHQIDLTQTGVKRATLWRQQYGHITGHGVKVDSGVEVEDINIPCGQLFKLPHLNIDDIEEIIESCVELLLT